MKFLVDNQLPAALCQFLVRCGHDCRHVLDSGLEEATDFEIWNSASVNGQIVVSKDEDFVYLANQADQKGRLLWVRIGNCRKKALIQRFESELPRILHAFNEGVRIVEIR